MQSNSAGVQLATRGNLEYKALHGRRMLEPSRDAQTVASDERASQSVGQSLRRAVAGLLRSKRI